MIRDCTDGSVQKCTPKDRKTNRPCSLGDCPKRLGEWKDRGLCIPKNNVRKCGEGEKRQTRSCTDGSRDVCNTGDTTRLQTCFVECKKRFGPWVKEDCVANQNNQKCGVGKQLQRRTCESGTNDPCSYSETTKTTTCYLGDCMKKLGEWKDSGTCKPDDLDKKCGAGQRLLTRSCEDGTKQTCRTGDTTRYERCFVECKKKLGPWVKGECKSNIGNQNCGFGQQIQTRTCEAGTNDPCLYSEMTKTTRCYLGRCLTGIENFLMILDCMCNF